MKIVAAIIAKFSRRNDEQTDAFEQRLMSMGAEKTRKPRKVRQAPPSLFVRSAAHA